MTTSTLRRRLGLFLVLSHFGLILLTVVLFVAHGFLFEEMTTTLALVVPTFASYTTAVVRYTIRHRRPVSRTEAHLSGEFVVFAFMAPALLIVLLVALMIGKAFNLVFKDFEQFKGMAIILEGLFAVYVGYFINDLFGYDRSREAEEAPHSSRPGR